MVANNTDNTYELALDPTMLRAVTVKEYVVPGVSVLVVINALSTKP